MGLVKLIVLTLVFSTTLTSCGLLGINDFFDRGHFNEHGQYEPKHPHFRLKDKHGHVFPHNLDTVNIYRLAKRTHYIDSSFQMSITYLKFFNKGRVLKISLPIKDPFGNPNKLKESDLNPNLKLRDKRYYYSKHGENFVIESFNRGLGYGRYSKSKFEMNETGDTLTTIGYIYTKEIIPTEWRKYPVDW